MMKIRTAATMVAVLGLVAVTAYAAKVSFTVGGVPIPGVAPNGNLTFAAPGVAVVKGKIDADGLPISLAAKLNGSAPNFTRFARNNERFFAFGVGPLNAVGTAKLSYKKPKDNVSKVSGNGAFTAQ